MTTSNQVASTQTVNIVPVQAVFNSAGVCLGLVGPGGNYFSPPLTAEVITGATIDSSIIGGTTPAAGSFTTLSATGHVTLEGVTSTGATGTGKLVFGTAPTVTSPVLSLRVTTEAALGAIANAINTTGKAQGTIVYTSDTHELYTADGSTAGAIWYRADGGTPITPA